MSRIESDVWNGSDTSVPSDAVFHQYTDFEMDNILRDGTIGTIDLADKSSKVGYRRKCQSLYMFDEDGRITKIYQLEFQIAN